MTDHDRNHNTVLVIKSKALCNSREQILSALGQNLSPEQFKRAEEAYIAFDKALGNYVISIYDNLQSLQDNTQALKAIKIDPYIAGGAANGIAGVGAGISTGIGADIRNQAIDETRKETAQRLRETTYNKYSTKNTLEIKYEALMEYVKLDPVANSIYEEAFYHELCGDPKP